VRNGTDLDLYGVLGVARDATAREIRRAYRRLARRHHPDLNPGPDNSQRFAAVANAYEILRDPVRRGRYDRTVGPSPAVRPRSVPRHPARPVTLADQLVQRGILELSADEAAHLTRRALALRDARGQTIVLPAGTRHGDHIAVLHNGNPAVLTVWSRAETWQEPTEIYYPGERHDRIRQGRFAWH
jgi:curved DNA-binding protein CbpA